VLEVEVGVLGDGVRERRRGFVIERTRDAGNAVKG